MSGVSAKDAARLRRAAKQQRVCAQQHGLDERLVRRCLRNADRYEAMARGEDLRECEQTGCIRPATWNVSYSYGGSGKLIDGERFCKVHANADAALASRCSE